MRTAMVIVLCLLALGCSKRETERPLLGTLEWDRIELTAEAAEPVIALDAKEGDAVAAGQPILRLDDRRAKAEAAALEAEIARLEATLSEQRAGPRREQILEAEARVQRAQSVRLNAEQDLTRARLMREKQMMAASDLDRAQANFKASVADLAAASANLLALKNGTRVEEIAQTEAALRGAQAKLEAARFGLDRLVVRAPRAAHVDTLPMKPGDEPARGATVAVLLAGDAPYARVYVPEHQRAKIAAGQRFTIEVEGVAEKFPAHLRHIESQASFTPYYALTGDDASRLTYLAQIDLDGDAAKKLPAGLPVRARVEGARAP
jgi:HlyD family secretion protein